MSKHTPGPWSMCLSQSNTAFLVRDTDKRLVCDMSWHSSSREHYPLRDESEANARLIASSPDMLSILVELLELKDIKDKGLREAAEHPNGSKHWKLKVDYERRKPIAWATARAVIAKATGEQA